MRPNPPNGRIRAPFRPPIPPQQSPTNQSVPLIVRCVLIGLTLLGLLLVVYGVKKPTPLASGGQGQGQGGTGSSIGSGTSAGGGQGRGIGGPGNTSGGGSGGTGQASPSTNAAQAGSSVSDSPSGQPQSQAGHGLGSGTGLPIPVGPFFDAGSATELNKVLRGIAKDSSDLSDWTLYQKINFHYHSIDEVLLTLMKYSRDEKATQAYAKFATAFGEIQKKPLDRYCARSIASHTKIMARVMVALAQQGVSDAAQIAELENMSKAIGDAPESLDDHDALMARVAADCLLRVASRNIRSQASVQTIPMLRNQIATSVENNGPIKASEIIYNNMAQVMVLGMEGSGEQASVLKASGIIMTRDERLPLAGDAFSRLEICLDATSQILMLYAGTLTK